MEIKAIKTRIFRENEDLVSFILKYVKKPPEKSVLVITSKIVALSEGKVLAYKTKKEKARLIKEESDFAVATKVVWMTIKDGMILASAGIDESNGNGKLILLPEDPYKSAEEICAVLRKKFKIKNLGVVIADSGLLPLRSGVIGMALGYAGFNGVRDYIGTKDIFGRVLKISKTNIADSLATSAVLCMGEGKEQQPLAVITDAPVIFSNRSKRNEIVIAPSEDIYAPLFAHLKTNAKTKKK